MNNGKTKFTPPEVAKLLGIGPDKVLAWIRSGELRAVNVATTVKGRPRYVIDQEDLAAFLEARSVKPKPKVRTRRRRAPTAVTEYF